jgi:hypothetical protein
MGESHSPPHIREDSKSEPKTAGIRVLTGKGKAAEMEAIYPSGALLASRH